MKLSRENYYPHEFMVKDDPENGIFHTYRHSGVETVKVTRYTCPNCGLTYSFMNKSGNRSCYKCGCQMKTEQYDYTIDYSKMRY